MPGRILIIDDEPLKRITLQIELSEQGYEVYEAADAMAARRIFESRPVDVVVTDIRMPGMNGLDLLTELKQNRPEVEVILMTAYATVDTAVLAIKRGAYDYITKPFTTPELAAKLDRLLAAKTPVQLDHTVESFGAVLARSVAMRRVITQLRAAAESDRNILLCGEAGVGKELLAQAIHAASRRANQPFVQFSGAGLPAQLVDSELFGLERSPAVGGRAKIGRIESSHGGTLLLDELDALPSETQFRLLQVVEFRQIERSGGDESQPADVRIIGACRSDVLSLVKAGRLRDDLYNRMNPVTVWVPPLRERVEDIPLLAAHFVAKHSPAGQEPVKIGAAALDELLRHTWPGNARELEHVLERGLAFCNGQEIRPEHVLPLARDPLAGEPAPLELSEIGRLDLNETVADIERRLILMALRQCNHNQARAAQKLGIPRTTLRDKMSKYNIPVS